MNTRNVDRIPLVELWNERGPVGAIRGEYVDETTVREALRRGIAWLVIADLGSPPRWYAVPELFDVWKVRIQPWLIDGKRTRWDSKDDCFFVGSRWVTDDGEVIVFEFYH